LRTGIDLSRTTDDREALAAYIDDPCFRRTTRVGLAADLLATAKQLHSSALALRVPALFLHGRRDSIAPWPDEVASSLRGPDREVRVFDHGYHNLFLDTRRHDVFDAIGQWLSSVRVRAR
jgi:alpha-beta hydrolase superfamily lysophospholipase